MAFSESETVFGRPAMKSEASCMQTMSGLAADM